MTDVQMLITAVGALGTTIVAMAFYIVGMHKRSSKEQKELLVSVTECMVKITTALENNNKIIDRLLK